MNTCRGLGDEREAGHHKKKGATMSGAFA